MKIFTFSFDSSPAQLQLLSTNSLYDLVDIAFEICHPRGDETAQDHLWHIKILDGSPSDDHDFGDGYLDQNDRFRPVVNYKYDLYGDDENGLCVQTTTLGDISRKLKDCTKLKLVYDYGSTSTHIITVISSKRASASIDAGEFPRRKPEPPVPMTCFSTTFVDLDTDYSFLNKWAFSSGCLQEVNLFQAGRKQHYGYLERWQRDVGQMIYLPDKAETLNHYLECLDAGASVRSSCTYDWHSVVVLPPKSKKLTKYNTHLEPGFIDCKVVGNTCNEKDLAMIFPKTAALGGFRKDKRVKKGWIRYKDETLMIVEGSGGTSGCPRAPKGTAYDGNGFHASGFDKVLFQVHTNIQSLHDLFCEVEGLLNTL